MLFVHVASLGDESPLSRRIDGWSREKLIRTDGVKSKVSKSYFVKDGESHD